MKHIHVWNYREQQTTIQMYTEQRAATKLAMTKQLATPVALDDKDDKNTISRSDPTNALTNGN